MIQLHVRGFNYSEIARHLNRHRSTIAKLIKDWKDGKFYAVKRRKKRRYLKLTAQHIHDTLNYFIDNPFHTYKQCIEALKLPVCARTIGNVLNKNCFGNFIACAKNFISMQNRINSPLNIDIGHLSG